MFTSDRPHLFGIPSGTDFSRAFVEGLDRLLGSDPFAQARATIYVNNRRTGRRITELMSASGARLLPRIVPVSDLGLSEVAGMPPPVPSLRRQLSIAQLIRALLDRQPDLAPRSAAFDLAESLVALMDEMSDEAVDPETLIGQDFGDLSVYWQRSAAFLSLVAEHFGPDSAAELTQAGRLASVVAALTTAWEEQPPAHPVIVAGSTGSRGSTHALMRAVSRLPNGAVVLPGFDFDLPEAVWTVIADEGAEDHPQFRFARLCRALDVAPPEVRPWRDAAGGHPRNRLISLALRPAPVSDQWIAEGPRLGDLTPATEGLTLIEAPTLRDEALSIALALRQAVEAGRTAAVVTPDRRLTRQVAAELERWGITADDSAGAPLALSPAGRLLRLAAAALAEAPGSEALLILLKHPLVNAVDRQVHLERVRRLELTLRRKGHPAPSADLLREMIADKGAWSDWVVGLVSPGTDGRDAADHVADHIALVDRLGAGPAGRADAAHGPWSGADGAEARRVMATLEREAGHGGWLTRVEYRDLVESLLARGEVRQAIAGHPQVRFWGTIEARVQGADLVILAGLNDGVWPAHPPPDPWMNRAMRRTVGLTSPERRIGLSAHDFQQAVSAPTAILTRSLRADGAQTVPSRWLARLTNLLDGLPEGKPALAAMRRRGSGLLALAAAMDRRAPRRPPVPRPAPRPPVDARPTQLSVTEFRTLVSDPYAIYARHVLRLRPLDPLRAEPDRPLQGDLQHKVLERFVLDTLDDPARMEPGHLLEIADRILTDEVHWPAVRQIWRARMVALADWFVDEESRRRQVSSPVVIETKGSLHLPELGFTLTGKPDRIDRYQDGRLEVVDYKSGKVPAPADIDRLDRQLWLLALMIEGGAFVEAGSGVALVTHYGLGETRVSANAVDADLLARHRDDLLALLRAYQARERGYASKRLAEMDRFEGDYDHLARRGEWSPAQMPEGEDVG
jgi:ATP-dependent helicase/nuclease subunit B